MRQPAFSIRLRLRHLLIIIGAAAVLGALALTTVAQGRNLLKNPGFEGDFKIQCSFPGGKPWQPVECDGPVPSMPWQTVQVVDGWVGWWQLFSIDRSVRIFY